MDNMDDQEMSYIDEKVPNKEEFLTQSDDMSPKPNDSVQGSAGGNGKGPDMTGAIEDECAMDLSVSELSSTEIAKIESVIISNVKESEPDPDNISDKVTQDTSIETAENLTDASLVERVGEKQTVEHIETYSNVSIEQKDPKSITCNKGDSVDEAKHLDHDETSENDSQMLSDSSDSKIDIDAESFSVSNSKISDEQTTEETGQLVERDVDVKLAIVNADSSVKTLDDFVSKNTSVKELVTLHDNNELKAHSKDQLTSVVDNSKNGDSITKNENSVESELEKHQDLPISDTDELISGVYNSETDDSVTKKHQSAQGEVEQNLQQSELDNLQSNVAATDQLISGVENIDDDSSAKINDSTGRDLSEEHDLQHLNEDKNQASIELTDQLIPGVETTENDDSTTEENNSALKEPAKQNVLPISELDPAQANVKIADDQLKSKLTDFLPEEEHEDETREQDGTKHDPLEKTTGTMAQSDTPFLTYSQSEEGEFENEIQDSKLSTSTGFNLPDNPVDGECLIQDTEVEEYNTSDDLTKPFARSASPEEIPGNVFEISSKTTGLCENIPNSSMSPVIARRPDLMEEVSMSSQSSRDSAEMDTKTETSKPTSEVESESGSVKDKRKTPAKRRNDLTQRMEDVPTTQPEEHRPEEQLYEYKWPLEGHADTYMLQEQISEYLGVLSFKRKYPDLERRNIDVKERLYLREKGVVTEMQADLGLTAVRADLIYDLMARDYPQKYKLYLAVLKERRKQQALERQREIQAQKTDKTRLEQLRQKAMQSASKFNTAFNRERREERRAYFDIHTFEIQYPRKQSQILPPEATKPGAYPVSLIPGQFQDYHKKYTHTELKYLPVNTAMYSSPCKVQNLYADPGPLPSDGEVSADEAASSEVSTESSEAGSDVESMELGSEIFEDEEDEEGTQQDTGKSPEQRKGEISKKVQEILERLKDKDKKSPRRNKTKITGGDESPAAKKRRGETDTESEKSRTPQRRKKISTRKVCPKAVVGGREVMALCNICGGTESQNASGVKENLVQCSECRRYGHPSCLELTPEMISIIKSYPWQCMECKTCVECKDSQNEDKMLFCDRCDRGYHTFCVGLTTIPNGRWECPSCRPALPKDVKIPNPNLMPDLTLAATSGVALIAALPHSKAP